MLFRNWIERIRRGDSRRSVRYHDDFKKDNDNDDDDQHDDDDVVGYVGNLFEEYFTGSK